MDVRGAEERDAVVEAERDPLVDLRLDGRQGGIGDGRQG
jgi:hypothetical protein